MDGRITVYVPIEDLNEVIGGHKPEMFWLTKPRDWDVAEVQIPLVVYSTWTEGNTGPRQLLKD